MAHLNQRLRMSATGLLQNPALALCGNSVQPASSLPGEQPQPFPFQVPQPNSLGHPRIQGPFIHTVSQRLYGNRYLPFPRQAFGRQRPPTRLPHPFSPRPFQPKRGRVADRQAHFLPGRTWLLPLDRMLVASAGPSRAAVEWTGHLFDNDDLIILLHCPSMFFLVEEDAQDWTEFYKVLSEKRRSHSEDILQAAKNKLQEMAKNRGKEVKIRSVVTEPTDSPKRKIVAYAKENNVDIVALGAHESSDRVTQLLGGTADYVAHHADCTVVICKDKTA